MPPRHKAASIDSLAARVLAGDHVELTWEMARHLYFNDISDRDARAKLAAWAKKHGIACAIVKRQTGPVMVNWLDLTKA